MSTAKTKAAVPETGGFLSGLTVGVFSLTLCLSAALMFAIQPMTGKMLLPIVGGTPSGWIVAMAFFQVMLLGGYLLAHLFSKFPPRLHAALYVVALAAGLYFMPVDIRQHAETLPTSPGPWDVFKLLCLSLSIPFIALSATSSTVQRLFTTTGHPSAHDPYFLYVASNLGSFAGLLLYPLVFEPMLSLSAQAGYSTAAYCGLIAGGLICLALSLLSRRSVPAAKKTSTGKAATDDKLSLKLCAEWAALSFVPSSLLLGVTIYITTDILSAPMVWVLPLCLYLLTFIIAFSKKSFLPKNTFQDLLPATALIGVLTMCVIKMNWLTDWTGMLFYLMIFMIVALACHIRLAGLRPLDNQSRHLTAFYLMMSVGGALGGVFNAFFVPLVADRLIEFPLVLVAALLLHPAFKPTSKTGIVTLCALALTAMTMPATPTQLPITVEQLLDTFFFTVGGVMIVFGVFSQSRQYLRADTLIALSAILLLLAQFVQQRQDVIFSHRNFYGTVRVFDKETIENKGDRFTARYLYHGTTLHGVQNITTPEDQKKPTAYYTEPGPLGDIFKIFTPKTVAGIGLGAGVVNCYEAPDRKFTFFEIDPAVVTVAEEQFTFLSACQSAAAPRVVIGDGRLELSKLENETFDLIIVDAFSSDSIPVHLLTLEAVEEYLSKTSPNGAIAFHVSNRYFILEDRIVAIAEKLGLNHSYRLDFDFERQADGLFRFPSKWIVLSRADVTKLKKVHEKWVKLLPSTQPLWTDDYSDIFGALNVIVAMRSNSVKGTQE
ncbi:MAG: fused MFS/spermidine synthase [Alphaproteobacteria bacterium]|nr:fused MFS/spermidine synthase [Alphaproteobacteria bacterium]